MNLRAQREQIQNTRDTVRVLVRLLCMLWLMSSVAATCGYGYRPRTYVSLLSSCHNALTRVD